MDLRLYRRCVGYIEHDDSDHVESRITQDKLEDILTYSGLNMNREVPKSKKSKQNEGKSYSNSSLTTDGEWSHSKKNVKQLNNYHLYANDDNLIRYKRVLASSIYSDNANSSGTITPADSKHVLQKSVEQKCTFVKNKTQVRGIFINNEENSLKTARADKASYCRPVTKHCSQDVVHKALERNIKLQLLVKKLVLAREKEKHNETWKTYINELRKKHGYYDYQPSEKPRYQTKLNSAKVKLTDRNVDRPQENSPSGFRTVSSYASNIYCYPTSAEGRLMMINQGMAMRRTSWKCEHGNKNNPIIVEKEKLQREPSNRKQHNKIWKSCGCNIESNEQQINFKRNKCSICCGNTKVETKHVSQQTVQADCECPVSSATGVETKEDTLTKLENFFSAKKSPLAKVENKLDILIKSFNAFVAECKAKMSIKTESTNTEATCGCEYKKIKSENQSFLQSNHDFTCAYARESESILVFPQNSSNWMDAIDTFSYDKNYKSDKIKRDIDEILTKNSIELSNPVQFPNDTMTKDYSTKVPDSLQTKQLEKKPDIGKEVRVEEIFSADDSKFMTIAVNTDPLGLSALIRVSADTVRQILSYVPSIDYSCLSRLPVCASPPNINVVARYMCNICGASFLRPAQLSDHIQKHNLANSRHCCVCKQLVKLESHCNHLFACQHCGQVFTRAYCRELHEQACARTVGKKHDVTPSRMLLR